MPRKIETAYIEYLPDLSRFTVEADRQLGKSLMHMEQTVGKSVDKIDTGFDQMADTVTRSFGEMERAAVSDFQKIELQSKETTDDLAREFQHAGEVAEDAFAELARSADRQLDRIDRDVRATTEGSSRRFRTMGLAAGAALLGVGAAATAGLGALATMGLSSAAQLEQVRVSLDSLVGSAEGGAKLFKQLQDFAAATPFEFNQLTGAAKRFLAFNEAIGMSNDQLFQFLTIIGDISAVTGAGAEGIDRVVLAIGQISSKGRVQLEELMQISEAFPGFSAIGAIADSLGVSTAKAMEMVSKGAIDAKTGIAAVLQGMQQFPGAAGAMEKQSQTLLGVWSTFSDVVGQTLAASFEPAIPEIKKTLTAITPIIGDALGKVAPAIGDVIVGVMPLLGELIKGIEPILTPLLAAVGPALSSLAPAIAPLGEALGGLIPPLVPLIPLIANFLTAVIQIATPLLNLLAPVLGLLTPIFQFLADAIGEFSKWFSTIDWGEVGDTIGHAFVDAWDSVSEFFAGIGEFFSNLPGQIFDFLKSLPMRFVKFIGNMFNLALEALGAGLALLFIAFTRFPGLLISAIANAPRLLWNFLTDMWTRGAAVIATGVDNAIEFFESIPQRIVTALVKLGPLLGKLFHDAFDRGRKSASNVLDNIVNFVKNLPNRIKNFAQDVGSSIWGFFKRVLNNAIGHVNAGIARVDDALPGITLPRLPTLAHGGVAFGPAIIGEDANTAPEAAIPLGDARALAMLRDALGTGGPTINFGPGSIIVNVNGGATADEARRIGENIGHGINETVATRNNIRIAVRTAG